MLTKIVGATNKVIGKLTEKTPAIHFRTKYGYLCGADKHNPKQLLSTEDPHMVTCKACIKVAKQYALKKPKP